jgi:hypothetical protein
LVLTNHIDVIFDLDSDLDLGVSAIPDQVLSVYFPIEDLNCPTCDTCMPLPR